MSRSFLEYMMEAENAQLYTTKDSSYCRHPSPEGGNDTIGYGHKLNVVENDTNMVYGYTLQDLNEEICRIILARDLEKKEIELGRKVWQFSKRSERTKEMMLDFQFNLRGGIGAFPKFKQAILDNDIETQRAEYKRYYFDKRLGRYEEIAERNRLFYSRYLSPTALREWDE